MSKKIKGTGVALVTPFHKDGSIDFRSLGKIVQFVIKGGVDFIVPLGTTGESVTLTKDEKHAVLDYVTEVNDKRVPLVYGLGGNNTQEIINCIKHTDFENIDAILSVSPYYNKPAQRGIYQHYKIIASASPVPVILYNVPGRTGSNIAPETTLDLAYDVKNIIAIKEASGNLEQVSRIIKDKPKDFTVLSGDDSLTLPMIAMGAEGVISVVANAFPKDFSELTRKAMEGDYEKSKKLHYKLHDITGLLFAEGNPAGVKAALGIMNICEDHLRLPLVGVSKVTYNKIAEAIAAL